MKKVFCLLFALILVLLSVGCTDNSVPKYENLLVTADTVESARFGMKYELPEGYAILTDDILQMVGDLDYEIQTGETVTVDGEEIPLRVLAMVTDYTDDELITFKIEQQEESVALSDTVDTITAGLGSEITFSGLQEIELLGTTGYTFSLVQSYENTTRYNVEYLVQDGEYILTIMCSGPQFPVNTTESIMQQFAK